MTDLHVFNWIEFDDLIWVAAAVSALTLLAIYFIFRRRRS